MLRMGKHVESLSAGTALLLYWPISQNYFNIYEGNSTLIGNIKNDDLRNLVILTYIQAKGLVDSFLMNNSLVQKQENYNLAYLQSTETISQQFWRDRASEQQRGLIEYASGIKAQHYELKHNIETLLSKLSDGK
jgi:hypothetical protein